MARVTRRRFLSTTAGVAALISTPVAPLSARRSFTQPSSLDAIIVGAGLAGLRAAEVLRDAGARVRVLEARPSAGGRVRTARTPFKDGLYGELGAVRISVRHRRVLDLAGRYSLALAPFGGADGASLVTVGQQSFAVPDELDALGRALRLRPDEAGLGQGALLGRYVSAIPVPLTDPALPHSALSAFAKDDAMTWPEWLRARGASPGAVTLMTAGGDSRSLSALYVLRQIALAGGASEFYTLHGGMDHLPSAMAAALGDTVICNAPVTRIEQTLTGVRVTYGGPGRTSTITASRVICTLPFSVLRQVVVTPRVSEGKARAIARLPYFPACRALLQTRSRFWRGGGSVRTDAPAEIWDASSGQDGSRGLIGVTVGGQLGASLAQRSRDAALAEVRALVAMTYGELASEYEAGRVHRWELDPWARGAFAVCRPGQMSTMMPEVATVEGRIHFAGEHTSAWMGWMEGALESAERAAGEVLSERA